MRAPIFQIEGPGGRHRDTSGSRWPQITLMVATMALLGCHLSTDLGSLHTAIELNRTVIRQGERVNILLHATNVGVNSVSVVASCAFGYRVYAADGSIVSPSRICLLDGRRLVIEAGATHIDTLIWEGNRSWSLSPDYVVPGDYTIVGAVTVDGAFRAESEPRAIEVMSRN